MELSFSYIRYHSTLRFERWYEQVPYMTADFLWQKFSLIETAALIEIFWTFLLLISNQITCNSNRYVRYWLEYLQFLRYQFVPNQITYCREEEARYSSFKLHVLRGTNGAISTLCTEDEKILLDRKISAVEYITFNQCRQNLRRNQTKMYTFSAKL